MLRGRLSDGGDAYRMERGRRSSIIISAISVPSPACKRPIQFRFPLYLKNKTTDRLGKGTVRIA